jgi:hypothetical protein
MNEDLLKKNNFNNFIGFSPSSLTASDIVISGEGWGITNGGTKVTMKKEGKMPVKIFFSLMKKKMGILKDYQYKKRIERLEKAVKEAEALGQIAFSEELVKKLLVLCKEAEMWAMNKKIFLDRATFEKFKNKTERPVALTPIKNYARPIPREVLAEKKKCDDAKLFDGYAVMHYDDKNTVKDTEKEVKEKREKDPILFGVVEWSDRLYFIADWEDEYCDLTLDDIISSLELEDEDITLSKKIIL